MPRLLRQILLRQRRQARRVFLEELLLRDELLFLGRDDAGPEAFGCEGGWPVMRV